MNREFQDLRCTRPTFDLAHALEMDRASSFVKECLCRPVASGALPLTISPPPIRIFASGAPKKYLSMFFSFSAGPPLPQSDAVAMSSELVDDVIVEAGTNISIGCPGVTRNTFVVQLEWRCQGQCGDEKTTAATTRTAAAGEHSLLKYVKDQGGSRLRLTVELRRLD